VDCLRCMNLEQAFDFQLNEYREARSAVFYQVSTELAAKKKVDMERARNDLEEHQWVCPVRHPKLPTLRFVLALSRRPHGVECVHER